MATNTGQFLFFDSTSTDLESKAYGVGADGGSCLTLQIMTPGGETTIADKIQAYGSVDMQEGTFNELKCINLQNFRTTNNMNVPSIYMVICSGVNYVKLVRDGSSTPIKAFAVAVG